MYTFETSYKKSKVSKKKFKKVAKMCRHLDAPNVYMNMKRILVLTHGELSKGFKSAHEVISAAESGINTVSLEPSDSPESLNEKIKAVLETWDEEDMKIVLTDIPYGSTSVTVMPWLATTPNLYVISGLNLALLLGVSMQEFTPGQETEELHSLIEQAKETVTLLNDQLTVLNDDEDD